MTAICIIIAAIGIIGYIITMRYLLKPDGIRRDRRSVSVWLLMCLSVTISTISGSAAITRVFFS